MLCCMLCCMLVQGRTQTLERTISEIKAKEQRSREILASLKHSYRYRGGMPSTILSFAFFCFQANLGCHNSNQQHHSQATSAVHARPAIRRAWSTISPGEPILFDLSHVAKTTCFVLLLAGTTLHGRGLLSSRLEGVEFMPKVLCATVPTACRERGFLGGTSLLLLQQGTLCRFPFACAVAPVQQRCAG